MKSTGPRTALEYGLIFLVAWLWRFENWAGALQCEGVSCMLRIARRAKWKSQGSADAAQAQSSSGVVRAIED